MKVIIAGTRNITNINYIYKAIQESKFKVTEVVSGAAKGVDRLGEKWAKANKIQLTTFPASWGDIEHPKAVIKTRNDGTKYDVTAGFRRNQQMADYADALIAIWNGRSGGTQDMINRAVKKGLDIYIYEVEQGGS